MALLAAATAELLSSEATGHSPLLAAYAPDARAAAARHLHELYGARMLPWVISGEPPPASLPRPCACVRTRGVCNGPTHLPLPPPHSLTRSIHSLDQSTPSFTHSINPLTRLIHPPIHSLDQSTHSINPPPQ